MNRVQNESDIPAYWEDVCPKCGAGNPNGCRCPRNDRTCRSCGARWWWKPVIEKFYVEGDYRIYRKLSHYEVEILDKPH